MTVGNPGRFPTRVSHLELGSFYAVEGTSGPVEVLPPQYFHLKGLYRAVLENKTTLAGTLYSIFWVRDACREIRHENWGTIAHQVGLRESGVNLTGKHDFHLRRIENVAEARKVLGGGRAYGDFLQQQAVDERKLVAGGPLS